MKKLIVLSLVFAMLASAAFAVDLSGTVFGTVNVIKGDTGDGSEVTTAGEMGRIRVDGSGSAADGVYGGYIRLDNGDVASANAWWKPIDQFKLTIGWNGDGFWGKEGFTGWGFNAMPYDSGVAINPGIWYWKNADNSFGGSDSYVSLPFMMDRYTFFGGFGDKAALLEIKPMDMLGINIAIPFFLGEKAADVYKATCAQIDLNFDFGNIALTYNGSDDVAGAGSAGALFAYFGGNFGALGIDFGVGYHLSGKDSDLSAGEAYPIGIGLGVKYATETFGVKFRTTAALAGGKGMEGTFINVGVLPYYAISDNLSVFLNAGLGMIMPKDGENIIGWFANPYLRVGAEWGPSFYAGVKLWSNGVTKDNLQGATNDSAIINWAVPIAIMVSF